MNRNVECIIVATKRDENLVRDQLELCVGMRESVKTIRTIYSKILINIESDSFILRICGRKNTPTHNVKLKVVSLEIQFAHFHLFQQQHNASMQLTTRYLSSQQLILMTLYVLYYVTSMIIFSFICFYYCYWSCALTSMRQMSLYEIYFWNQIKHRVVSIVAIIIISVREIEFRAQANKEAMTMHCGRSVNDENIVKATSSRASVNV